MKLKIACLILVLASALFLIITVMIVSKPIKIKKLGVSAESTVLKSYKRSSKSGLPDVTVNFLAGDGSQITATARKRNRVSAGEKTMVYYDPAIPQNIAFADTIGYDMRGVIISGFLFLVGLFYFIRFSIKDFAINKLISAGQKIAADFVSIVRNEKYRMGDSNPWVIKCKWIDNRNNQEYLFTSKDYTIDPAPFLNGRNQIDIFIDPLDPGKYYMDTSFMPKGNNTIG